MAPLVPELSSLAILLCGLTESAAVSAPSQFSPLLVNDDHSTQAESDERPLFAYTNSGGGLLAFSSFFAMASSLTAEGLMSKITHVGTNSGGSWASTSLFFSDTYNAMIANSSADAYRSWIVMYYVVQQDAL